jgi:hypothetical protein
MSCICLLSSLMVNNCYNMGGIQRNQNLVLSMSGKVHGLYLGFSMAGMCCGQICIFKDM